MAYIEEKHCAECEQELAVHTNGKCNICAERKNRVRIAQWNALTVDEKLQNIRQRLERLERPTDCY